MDAFKKIETAGNAALKKENFRLLSRATRTYRDVHRQRRDLVRNIARARRVEEP